MEESCTGFCRAWVVTLFLIVISASLFAQQNQIESESHAGTVADRMIDLPTGQQITPDIISGSEIQSLNPGLSGFPDFVAGGAIHSVLSPDGSMLAILTSGFNLNYSLSGKKVPAASQEYVFLFDVKSRRPVLAQVLTVPNSFAGLAFDPAGARIYVGGGKDDNVHIFTRRIGGRFEEREAAIALGHRGAGALSPDPAAVDPEKIAVTAGLAVTADGKELVIADTYQDSITVVDLAKRMVKQELDLRPGKIDKSQAGVAGGEYPFWVVIRQSETAYISSIRDREIVVVHLGDQAKVTGRIKLRGNPNKLLLRLNLLFATCDNSDSVEVINTDTNAVVESIPTAGDMAPAFKNYSGSAPNSLAISPDAKLLYVTNGGSNSIGVIELSVPHSKLIGLLPTTFYPTQVTLSKNGRDAYVINGKSVTGPNEKFSRKNRGSNQYVEQLLRSSLLTFPIPAAESLAPLTRQVLDNNRLNYRLSGEQVQLISELRTKIKHIIYIVKENRTYDQVLGDLGRGDGDSKLTEFGWSITPNFHELAKSFVDLDNFYDPGDVSGDGWPWSTSGRESDFGLKAVPLSYADRGTAYEYEGVNRNINVGLSSLAGRKEANPDTSDDPDLLPGAINVVAPDGPADTPSGRGYLWDSALRAGLRVRNYGFFVDLSRYTKSAGNPIPRERDPFADHLKVTYVADPNLIGKTDEYFRGIDLGFPDLYREMEWEREFGNYVKQQDLPELELVRFGGDHMGGFGSALDEVNTPEKQQADNDYAVGRLVEKVAQSPFKSDTLILIVEDDAQNGADHVDSHRSTAYVVGPYIKQGAVISERYTTVNLLRSIEELLNLDHLNVNTASQRPMLEIFDLKQENWNFLAQPSDYLAQTKLPLPHKDKGRSSTHDGYYWAQKTAQFDFSREDNLGDPEAFNRIIWAGLKGNTPYPGD